MHPMTARGSGAAPTIVDVARAASVSKTTASDALRGQGRVSEQTREIVVRVARELGYTPNRSARSLRTAVAEAIGLHIPEFLTRSDYYRTFVFGVIEQAAVRNYNVTLISSGHLPQQGPVPHVDGLVLCDPVAEDPVVRDLAQTSVPIVTAERFVGAPRPMGVVESDHERLTIELFDHLRDQGAGRVALLASGTTSDWSVTVQRTYRDWARRRKLPVVLRAAPFGSSPEVIRGVVEQLLREDPEIDALVCAADGAAAAVLPTINAAGRAVGKDFLLASGVDSPAMQLADPPITAIALDPQRMGAECAELLCEIIAGDAAPDAVREMPIELRLRASTRA
jgi:DNA-binding LacI/PurR family transcriptional regulator